ncbi:MAG: DNA repair protein RadC [Caldilineaceae bacterium]|nr:DNA repair protein RadC [Caldilineaceae bacterium]
MGQPLDSQLSLPWDILQQAEEDALIQRAIAVLARRCSPGEPLASPEDVKACLQLRLFDRPHEVFGCIFLTQRHAVIAIEDIFTGTIDGASVYPRVVVQRALVHNAAALICYHNHPSGNPEPSQADQRITERLKKALALVDIRTLDHVVVAPAGCVSFAERGLL